MNRILKTTALAAAMMSVAGVAQAQEREQLRIVGSSTVYPFASYVVEEFGVTTDYQTPVIESTGSGGGLKLFCEGVGLDAPDITNASRRIKVSEFQRCQENGVTDITEAKIGYDGIVLAEAASNEPVDFTRKQLFLALAAKVPQDGKLVANPYEKWSDIDPSLPDREIEVYGPPTTSGTRDAFEELVMEAGSEHFDIYGDEGYTNIRQDGAYIDAGENDNLIVQRLQENTTAFGIFGYSFLEENQNVLTAATIEGVEPVPEAIGSGEYPVARSLFFYVKNQHADSVPSMYPYVNLFMSEKMIGPMGYLKGLGLIPLPEEMREKQRNDIENREQLKLSDLK